MNIVQQVLGMYTKSNGHVEKLNDDRIDTLSILDDIESMQLEKKLIR